MITLFQNDITNSLKRYKPYSELLTLFTSRRFPFQVAGPAGSFLAFLLSRLLEYGKGSFLIVVPTEQEAESLVSDFELAGTEAALFPWWESLPYRDAAQNSAAFGTRVQTLARLLSGEKLVLVAPLRAFLTPLPPPEYLKKRLVRLHVRESIDPVRLGELLTEFGYLRVPRVTVRGEFALRGEVLDLFLPGMDEAARIVFEFDRIEEIKLFDPETQSSTGKLTEIALYPHKEVTWGDEELYALEKRLSELEEFSTNGAKTLEHLRLHREMKGEELFYPLVFDSPAGLRSYLSPDSTLFLLDYERLGGLAETLRKEYEGLYRQARHRGEYPLPHRILLEFDRETEAIERRVLFPLLRSQDQNGIPRVSFPYDGPRSFFGNVQYLREELGKLTSAGYRIYVFADTESQAARIEYLLSEYRVTVLPDSITGGFTLPELKIMAIQEHEIFGRRRRIPKSVKQAKSRVIDSFVELNPGDYVVHANYGIGRFRGIERVRAAGNERDYIHLEYAGEEFIFIPIEQVNLIQRYIGSEGNAPRLDKIGGKSWESRKNRVKQSVEDLAGRLLKLYSRRKQARGFAFPRDTEWQYEFEALFPYEETPDQLSCIEDVKSDMESPTPMDRMICGDVGYGKTEIAMRAAFKAVMGGKQVAFLAPTTILVEQHFENFQERFGRFPVRIAMLSRFVPKQEQKETLAKLKTGEIDLVIGTHRLLQKDVAFKDLGLLMIDEEQRFGVKDKERLKELKTSVDCLTLTATPIPRTLHMSLLKIRDMSLLTTPPHNRRPIETVIQEWSEELVAEAIRKEIARGGQVYYLHNRVETLDHVKLFLQKVVPEVLIETAHGQMNPNDLEDIMHRFIHGAFHVLVSTTIIENGIDIPNVNTIVIDRADMYGISQLYQLRGRVGRSGKLAYAYLMYPEQRALSEIAMKRLQIISDFTELGSGFKIALKDLEVRGAGNLLGREQSGDILSVGFDMYLRLLDEAIAELSGEKEDQPEEINLELEYSGYIPDGYISEPMVKMEVYKKIAGISRQEELDGLYGDLVDRFGPLPDEVHSLFSLAEIRILCRDLGISSLKERRGEVEIEFSRVANISVDRLLRLMKESAGAVRLNPHKPNVLILKTGTIGLKEKSEFIRERIAALV
jgi:transcription-repair coupling factor (superfamily II helicase)